MSRTNYSVVLESLGLKKEKSKERDKKESSSNIHYKFHSRDTSELSSVGEQKVLIEEIQYQLDHLYNLINKLFYSSPNEPFSYIIKSKNYLDCLKVSKDFYIYLTKITTKNLSTLCDSSEILPILKKISSCFNLSSNYFDQNVSLDNTAIPCPIISSYIISIILLFLSHSPSTLSFYQSNIFQIILQHSIIINKKDFEESNVSSLSSNLFSSIPKSMSQTNDEENDSINLTETSNTSSFKRIKRKFTKKKEIISDLTNEEEISETKKLLLINPSDILTPPTPNRNFNSSFFAPPDLVDIVIHFWPSLNLYGLLPPITFNSTSCTYYNLYSYSVRMFNILRMIFIGRYLKNISELLNYMMKSGKKEEDEELDIEEIIGEESEDEMIKKKSYGKNKNKNSNSSKPNNKIELIKSVRQLQNHFFQCQEVLRFRYSTTSSASSSTSLHPSYLRLLWKVILNAIEHIELFQYQDKERKKNDNSYCQTPEFSQSNLPPYFNSPSFLSPTSPYVFENSSQQISKESYNNSICLLWLACDIIESACFQNSKNRQYISAFLKEEPRTENKKKENNYNFSTVLYKFIDNSFPYIFQQFLLENSSQSNLILANDTIISRLFPELLEVQEKQETQQNDPNSPTIHNQLIISTPSSMIGNYTSFSSPNILDYRPLINLADVILSCLRIIPGELCFSNFELIEWLISFIVVILKWHQILLDIDEKKQIELNNPEIRKKLNTLDHDILNNIALSEHFDWFIYDICLYGIPLLNKIVDEVSLLNSSVSNENKYSESSIGYKKSYQKFGKINNEFNKKIITLNFLRYLKLEELFNSDSTSNLFELLPFSFNDYIKYRYRLLEKLFNKQIKVNLKLDEEIFLSSTLSSFLVSTLKSESGSFIEDIKATEKPRDEYGMEIKQNKSLTNENNNEDKEENKDEEKEFIRETLPIMELALSSYICLLIHSLVFGKLPLLDQQDITKIITNAFDTYYSNQSQKERITNLDEPVNSKVSKNVSLSINKSSQKFDDLFSSNSVLSSSIPVNNEPQSSNLDVETSNSTNFIDYCNFLREFLPKENFWLLIRILKGFISLQGSSGILMIQTFSQSIVAITSFELLDIITLYYKKHGHPASSNSHLKEPAPKKLGSLLSSYHAPSQMLISSGFNRGIDQISLYNNQKETMVRPPKLSEKLPMLMTSTESSSSTGSNSSKIYSSLFSTSSTSKNNELNTFKKTYSQSSSYLISGKSNINNSPIHIKESHPSIISSSSSILSNTSLFSNNFKKSFSSRTWTKSSEYGQDRIEIYNENLVEINQNNISDNLFQTNKIISSSPTQSSPPTQSTPTSQSSRLSSPISSSPVFSLTSLSQSTKERTLKRKFSSRSKSSQD